ncbi:MAG: lysophospholipid acyltransferase family protein [Vulcanimicrobiaceae bacterium]
MTDERGPIVRPSDARDGDARPASRAFPGGFDRSFYTSAKGCIRLMLLAAGRITARGLDRVPRTGPLIVACNHVSYVDPPALGAMLPRPIAYMAKKELFAIPVLGGVIRKLGAFPVDRQRGDTAAMKAALRVLETGAALGIFPEGTRNVDGSVQAQLGVALLAAMSGATVIPAYVSGTRHLSRFAKITVTFGEPLEKRLPRKASRDELAKWTQELMSRIYALRENT